MFIWDLLKMLLDKNIAVVIMAVNFADSLSLADRLIRLEKGRADKVYRSREFSTIPFNAPWVDVYQDIVDL
jgi:ribose transport system ATP-binding protein